jgi:site-specific recombinase XerD
MLTKGFSENTIRAFRNNLRFVATLPGAKNQTVSGLDRHFEFFLPWLEESRGLTFSAKTQARRIRR